MDEKPRQRWIECHCHDYVNDRHRVRQCKAPLAPVRRLFVDWRRVASSTSLCEVDDDGAVSRLIGGGGSGRRRHRPYRRFCRGLARERRRSDLRDLTTAVAKRQEDRRTRASSRRGKRLLVRQSIAMNAHRTVPVWVQEAGEANCLSLGTARHADAEAELMSKSNRLLVHSDFRPSAITPIRSEGGVRSCNHQSNLRRIDLGVNKVTFKYMA
jgi:hypothetical protein